MKPIRKEIIFSGRVQGVGFRYTSAQVARHYDVTGWVKNLPDRTVQMIVEGSPDVLRAYVDAVCSDTHGRVNDCCVVNKLATGEFVGFEIRH